MRVDRDVHEGPLPEEKVLELRSRGRQTVDDQDQVEDRAVSLSPWCSWRTTARSLAVYRVERSGDRLLAGLKKHVRNATPLSLSVPRRTLIVPRCESHGYVLDDLGACLTVAAEPQHELFPCHRLGRFEKGQECVGEESEERS
ncbi:hypothetical protein NKG05_24695 [Oerskovia sp. M15]